MLTKQRKHEIDASRQATEELRMSVQRAIGRGYFSSTKFGRKLVREYTKDFAEALIKFTSKESIGRATKTNIAITAPVIKQIFELEDPKVISNISLKSILDSFGRCNADKPVTYELASFIGKRIEDQVRVSYYTQVLPDDLLRAQHKQLNTPGSHPEFKRYGAKQVVEKLLEAKNIDEKKFPGWSLKLRSKIGLFVVEVAAIQGLITLTRTFVSKNNSPKFVDLSPELKGLFNIFMADQEQHSFKEHPLIEPPREWELIEGAAKFNCSGGYHHEWMRQVYPLCRGYRYESVFGSDAIDLLNILGKTAWKIDSTIYKVAKQCLEKGFSVGSLKAVIWHPLLDQNMPPHLVELSTSHPDRVAWKKEMSALKTDHAYQVKRGIRSRQSIALAGQFIQEPRFYLSWSCDYRGRMYPQQSLLHKQTTDSGKAMLTFEDGCYLNERSELLAAQAIGSAFVGSKVTFQDRILWTYHKKELIQAIANDPIRLSCEWEECYEPWQFLQ